jgi:hypothetical protein
VQKLCARRVPILHTVEHKTAKTIICLELLQRNEKRRFFAEEKTINGISQSLIARLEKNI